MTVCLNCNASESKKPLLTIKFQGNEIYICPQCGHERSEVPDYVHITVPVPYPLDGAEHRVIPFPPRQSGGEATCTVSHSDGTEG